MYLKNQYNLNLFDYKLVFRNLNFALVCDVTNNLTPYYLIYLFVWMKNNEFDVKIFNLYMYFLSVEIMFFNDCLLFMYEIFICS